MTTITIKPRSATTNTPKITAKATFEARSGSGRREEASAMASARVEERRAGTRPRVTAGEHTAGMVLVTPQQSTRPRRPSPSKRRDPASGEVQPDRPKPARDEVLALLRDGPGGRPRFDPGLAGGLRAWLEDGASELVAARGEDAPPLFLGPHLLLGEPARTAPDWVEQDPYPLELVLTSLVRALFRQIVTTGSVGNPLDDAVDALRVDPRRSDMVRRIEGLSEESHVALSASLATHVAHLQNLTPRFATGWLPRTRDRVAIPLAGGRVVLCGVFDLLVGAPVPGTATQCAVGLTTGGRWAQARTGLHYLALLETLRSGTPPFRVALLNSAVGSYGVEDLLEEHLGAIVSHLVARLSTLGQVGGEQSDGQRANSHRNEGGRVHA
jgi:hypothetical protein